MGPKAHPFYKGDRAKVQAELDARVSKPKPAAACPPNQTTMISLPWVGPYVGIELVGSWSDLMTREFFASTDMLTNHFNDTGSGVGGGINVGKNWRWEKSYIFGVVADANLLDDKVRHDFAGGNYIGATMTFTASVQARAGVLVTPNLLLYGQTGLSIGNQQLQIDFGGPETNESDTTLGYTLGGGAEWMLRNNALGLGQSTSLFVSFEHTWWNKATLRMPAASPAFDYAWLRETNTVKFGARVHF